MYRFYYILALILFSSSSGFCTSALRNTPSETDNFFKALLSDSGSVSEFVLDTELEKSRRLGITYEGVRDKFLISYDIDKDIKLKIWNGSLKYEVKKEDMGEGFLRAVFSVKGMSYKREFFFKDNKYISPSFYYTRSWKNIQSRFFNFFISTPDIFNSYSADKLDEYVDAACDLLKISKSDKELLARQKINYILCKDNAEIEKLTGFSTRGMYTLAFDEIVTTFNCHFHELSHLLINFRLKSLPLYTLPFLQEGFASATGGRGGIMRNVLLEAGYYLQKAGYIPYNSILTKKDFSSEDASMTYPVSGLYNIFLLNELGVESYLKLYRSYSGSSEYISSLMADSIRLPSPAQFDRYLNGYRTTSGVSFEAKGTSGRLIYEGSNGKIYDYGSSYMFKVKSNMVLSAAEKPGNYRSKKFEEIFPEAAYTGGKYLITVNLREVSIYNLYTNNLSGSYSTGFSLSGREVPSQDGYFQFYINKDIFDEDLQYLQVHSL